MANKLTTYSDTLLFPMLLKAINEAQSSIILMTFVFKTSYGSPNRAQQIADALIAAAQRGVKVYVILNYSQYEPDVCVTNFQTAAYLSAGGCRVRLGPKNTTLHGKLALIDDALVFVGSHNITRGALSLNREVTVGGRSVFLAGRIYDYLQQVWESSTRFEEATPPTGGGGPVEIALAGVTTVGEEIRLSFTVNHVEGVEAFAIVADDDPSLAGAKMGESVSPSQRTAGVAPEQPPGATIFVAVRAYREGGAVATSPLVQMVYQIEGTPSGGGDDSGEGGGEPPPPPPLAAPTLTTVTQTAETTVRLVWDWVGNPAFDRFEFQQRDLQGNWHLIGSTMNAATREWIGTPLAISDALPFRVVVYNTTSQSAESNMMYLQAAPPPPPPPGLTPPVVVSVTQIGPMGINVEYSHVTPAEFTRYEVQQRTNETWNTLATITTPETRSWSGGPIPYMDADHPVRVVVFVQSGDSAGSNEMVITPM